MNNKANTECIKKIIFQVKIRHRYLKPRAHLKACHFLGCSFRRLVTMDQGFLPPETPGANELPGWFSESNEEPFPSRLGESGSPISAQGS